MNFINTNLAQQNKANAGLGALPAAASGWASNASEPMPTAMQTHVQRAQEVNMRLNATAADLTNLLIRIYGEANSEKPECQTDPLPAGLSSAMTCALSSIEATADLLFQAAVRLSQFA